MKAKINHLDGLLDKIREKTSQPLDWAGFGEMGEILEEHNIKVSQKYLYDFHRATEEAHEKGDIILSLNIKKLDDLARFVGFSNYRQFTERMDKPIDPVLLGCVGNYYSYVRQNDNQGFVLQSPVKIEVKDGKVWFELKGGTWTYRGELQLTLGCLFVLMTSKVGKMIHHVYKIGARENAVVIQGIFSGVSTTSDPIGGRAVLIRATADFDALSNKKLAVDKIRTSKDITLQGLAKYFNTREQNNLAIHGVGMTFEREDLFIRNAKKKKAVQEKSIRHSSKQKRRLSQGNKTPA